jgi:hypothetical protein
MHRCNYRSCIITQPHDEHVYQCIQQCGQTYVDHMHLNTHCPNTECLNSGCTFRGNYKQRTTHDLECMFRQSIPRELTVNCGIHLWETTMALNERDRCITNFLRKKSMWKIKRDATFQGIIEKDRKR